MVPDHMSWLQVVLLIVCVAIVIIPSKYDPAIRWKERNEKRKRNNK